MGSSRKPVDPCPRSAKNEGGPAGFAVVASRPTASLARIDTDEMVALARAYVRQPRIVLLDEVSMGLAPKVVDEIFAFLDRMAAEGASLLLVEQFVTKALAIADFVFLLAKGQIDFVGEPSELADDDIFTRYAGASFVT